MEEQQVTYGFGGFKKSVIDGSEHIFGVTAESEIPKSYSYKKYMPKIVNQESDPICVPCSISAFLNWRENLDNGKPLDNHINYFEIYDSKTTYGDGMTFKEAFRYLRHTGVNSDEGILKINEYAMIPNMLFLKNEYAMIPNMLLLKYAIVMNGPCVGALPVYNYSSEFWNKRAGDNLLGYHAISIIGYDEEGFIIRNSWGESFGENGYTEITYDDSMRNFIEIWTCL